jgi:archaellin
MNNKGNLGATTGIFLILMIIIGAIAASAIIQTTQSTSIQDLTKITNEAIDEITTTFQIKNVVGKYDNIQGRQCIQKIAIFIKPLVSLNIDIAKINLMTVHGDDLRLLSFNGLAAPISTHSLFDHPLWDSMDEASYSVITTVDDDCSMTDSHIIDKNTDMAFLIVKLPSTAPLYYGQTLQITLIPTPGNECTVTLEPPLPTTHVVSLYG